GGRSTGGQAGFRERWLDERQVFLNGLTHRGSCLLPSLVQQLPEFLLVIRGLWLGRRVGQRVQDLIDRSRASGNLLKQVLRLIGRQLPVRDLGGYAVLLEDSRQQRRAVEGVAAPRDEGCCGPFHDSGIGLKCHLVADKFKGRLRRREGLREGLHIGQRLGKAVQVGLQPGQAALESVHFVFVG